MAIGRRSFLKSVAAQTGAFALGALGGGARASAATGATAATEATGASTASAGFSRALPDVAVIGAGAFGGWTAYYLRKAGARVTLIDAYGPGNSRATSGDETRGVRTSYGDRSNGELWMRWASKAITRWKEWDAEWGREMKTQLFYPTSDLIMREDWEPFLTETHALFEKVGIRHEVLPVAEVAYRYPVIDLKHITVVLHELDAGVVRARRACENVCGVFQQLGGTLVLGRARLGALGNGQLQSVYVAGQSNPIMADAFVFACGPWLGKVFPEALKDRIRTPTGYVYYFGTPVDDDRFTFPNLPSYNFPGITGWPALVPDNRGFRVRTGGGPEGDPDTSQRAVDPSTFDRPRSFLKERFPLLRRAPVLETRECHYELSTSGNFIIDRHPALNNVWIAGGGSAEGFKFGPVVGEYVAGRVLGTETDVALAKQFLIPPLEPPEPLAAGPLRENASVFTERP
jgi:glycine/D-amino acid oxidase-like deaminating enzyme